MLRTFFLLCCGDARVQKRKRTGYDGAMSDWVKLKAEDGHELKAYVARPKGDPIGALVLVQEIFGINCAYSRCCGWICARMDFW